ncbi:MAG: hypothetical protein IPI88_16665 [Chitinophagaceae bacterium]|nr:hypothetical protein [Chitinophagaceae bacterium]
MKTSKANGRWEKVLDKSDSTKESGQWAIGNGQWAAGWYKIIATTKDKYGETVKAEKYIQLTNSAASEKYMML